MTDAETMGLTECFFTTFILFAVTFKSKDLEPYRGQKVLVDESLMFNNKQTKVSKGEKYLRVKVEMRDENGQPFQSCNSSACVRQRTIFTKKRPHMLQEPLHMKRSKEDTDVVVENDSFVIELRPVCGCYHKNPKVPFALFFVEVLDEKNVAVFRAVFLSDVKNQVKGSSDHFACNVELKKVN